MGRVTCLVARIMIATGSSGTGRLLAAYAHHDTSSTLACDMKLKKITVSVKIGDNNLQELDVKTHDQSATCFIPSEEGAVSVVRMLICQERISPQSRISVSTSTIGPKAHLRLTYISTEFVSTDTLRERGGAP